MAPVDRYWPKILDRQLSLALSAVQESGVSAPVTTA
jgi:hypothetical protein